MFRLVDEDQLFFMQNTKVLKVFYIELNDKNDNIFTFTTRYEAKIKVQYMGKRNYKNESWYLFIMLSTSMS